MSVGTNLAQLEVLIDLLGSLIYGYLARELIRDPRFKWPLRLAAIFVAVWYLGCFGDELISAFGLRVGRVGSWLDLGRGFAAMLSLPMTAAAALFEFERRLERSHLGLRVLLAASALPLIAVLPTAKDIIGESRLLLQRSVAEVAPELAIWAFLSGITACVGVWWIAAAERDQGLAKMLRMAALFLAALTIAFVIGPVILGDGSERAAVQIWRLTGLGLGLGPGLALAMAARQANLMGLAVRRRSIRHLCAAAVVACLGWLALALSGAPDVWALRGFVSICTLTLVGLSVWTLLETALERRLPVAGRVLLARPLDLAALRGAVLGEDEDDRAIWAFTRELSRQLGVDVEQLRGEEACAQLVAGASRLESSGPALEALESRSLQAAVPIAPGHLIGIGTGGAAGSREEIAEIRLACDEASLCLELRRQGRSLVEAERRLIDAERLAMLGQVSASLAHEIGNPLGALASLSESLLEDLSDGVTVDEGRLRQDLEVIADQALRVRDSSLEILGFARGGQGEGCRLDRLARSVVKVLGAEARSKGQTLVLIGAEEACEVTGSPVAWQSVAFNLVVNAVRHGSRGDEIVVEIGQATVPFEVRNRLEGEVDPESLRADWVSSGGTGLGLGLAERRAEELGHELELIVDRDDSGQALFIARLRRSQAPAMIGG